MKKATVLIAVISLLSISQTSKAQAVFGVSPGIGLNTAYFGLNFDKVVPYIGFQYLAGGSNLTESDSRYDYEEREMVNYTEEYKLSGGVYIPNIGVKVFLSDNNNLKTYLSANLSKPILSGSAENDGEKDEDFKEKIKSIKLWGTEVGFGVEYFVSDHFSLGGEFGLRYFHLKQKDTRTQSVYNGYDFEEVETSIETKYKVSPTFTKISLNYYF